jgi:hypothetical protein
VQRSKKIMVKALATKNVVTVLAALALVIGLSFASIAPAKADTVSNLQSQVQALLAQIQSLQGSTTTTTSTASCFTFTQNLSKGKSGGEVMWIQKFLNSHGFTVATTGAGSSGNESSYFGAATKAAVIKFQNAYASDILTPVGLTAGNGNWFAGTRAKANALCVGSTTTTTTGTGGTTTTTGPGITVTAGTQPANSLAPQLASRVPFTTFTITNNSGAAVTINGINVQRTGLAADVVFAGVELIDQNGLQIGTSRTFNSNHQAEIGSPWTLAAGASMTYTVAGNMIANEINYAGQVAGVSVIGVDTSVPVNGSLPISGAQQTINASLVIGTASAQRSSFDPLNARSEPIGTTALIFSGIRVTAGSAEDEKLYSITWNQTGSVGSTDIGNLKTYVNGTAYPVTVDSTGKYFSSIFPGGILVAKGNSADVYIQGDLIGGNSSGRTAEFDIYRQSDVYLVGQTYGYGVTPTPGSTPIAASLQTTAPWTSGFIGTGTGTSYVPVQPFYQGAQVSVTAGTLSTVGNAGSVGSQNIAINVPNQPLGGFITNFTGESVTAQSLTFTVATSSGADKLTSVSIVDQNGNTIAGPVDENGTNQLAFTSSVTFPVGAMTYTLKGTVGSNAINGSTYQLSTNPGTNWLSPQGQTSGSSVSLPNTVITMSTMTVQAGQLAVSAASTPASTNVAPGANNFVIANINLDASQSGENVRLSSLPIVIDATSTGAATILKSALTNCQLWNGTTALNTQSVGSNQWAAATVNSNTATGVSSTAGLSANFVFQNAITIPKGTVTTLALECNISSSLYNGATFAGGVDSLIDTSANLIPTGAQSGNSITSPLVTATTNSVSGTMTVGSASLAVTNPSPLSYALVAGGTTGVTVGSFTLQPTSDSVNLQNIGLSLNSSKASTADIARAYIVNSSGVTVGTVNFTGAPVGGFYYATSSISSLNIPQNQQTIFTIKADLNQIGPSSAGTDGHEVLINLSDAQGVGASSGTSVNSGNNGITQSGVSIFRTTPTVAVSNYLSSNGISDGRLIAFTITAGSNGPVGIAKFNFTISPSSGTTIATPTLYAYTDAGFSQPAGGTTGGIVNSTAYNATNATASTTVAVPLEIQAGSTMYFLLKGTVSPSGTTYNIATTLQGDTINYAPTMFQASGTTTPNFIWSPNATTTALSATNDWTNGFSVSGLSSIGITQNRTN